MVVVLVLTLFSLVGCDPIVIARTGRYIGNKEEYLNTTFFSFRGIKFASQVRFKPSVLMEDSSKTFLAKEYGPACLQINQSHKITGVEDCLYLNVFTPNVTGSYPVMVFIHGGAFVIGSVSSYDPSYFMETEQVVYVTIQYRLGPFGFLDFNSRTYPSNLGLKDQRLALIWVQRNIQYFGGDPSKVTLQGESAGGVSVHLQMLSPLNRNKDLFRAGISHSGTACAFWGVAPKQRSRIKLITLVKYSACSSYTEALIGASLNHPADEIAECLSKLPLSDFALAISKFKVLDKFLPFLPVLESSFNPEAFITEYPCTGPRPQVPWIGGISNDGTAAYQYFISQIPIGKILVKGIDTLLPYILFYKYTASKPSFITRKIKEFYLAEERLTVENILSFGNNVGNDAAFIFPNYLSHSLHSNSSSWKYVFAYKGKSNSGVAESGDLIYLFPNQTYNVRLDGNNQDVFISFNFVKALVSFAVQLNPNTTEISWNSHSANPYRFLWIDETGFKMADIPYNNSNNFWSNLPFRNKLLYFA